MHLYIYNLPQGTTNYATAKQWLDWKNYAAEKFELRRIGGLQKSEKGERRNVKNNRTYK